MIAINFDEYSPSEKCRIPAHGINDFSSLWGPAAKLVRAFLSGVVYAEEDRNDLLQTVAQQAFCAFHTFSPRKGSFIAWTMGIARNEFLHYLRSQRRACVLFDSELADRAIRSSSYSDEAEGHAVHQVLQRELDRLPASQHDLLKMKYVENLTCMQIAQRLSVTESTIKMRLSRIRSHLKRRLLPLGPLMELES